jgi:hypothetical protein
MIQRYVDEVMNVLVIFHSEDGEELALTLALGAVQAKCDIRLRRLGATVPKGAIHKGYVAPRDQDLEWADALVLAIASRNLGLRSEVEEFLVRLKKHPAIISDPPEN